MCQRDNQTYEEPNTDKATNASSLHQENPEPGGRPRLAHKCAQDQLKSMSN